MIDLRPSNNVRREFFFDKFNVTSIILGYGIDVSKNLGFWMGARHLIVDTTINCKITMNAAQS